MLYGKLQNAIWLFFLVLGAATATLFVLRDLLGLGTWPVFAAWLLVLVIGGRTSYLSWRRDWGNESERPSPRENR